MRLVCQEDALAVGDEVVGLLDRVPVRVNDGVLRLVQEEILYVMVGDHTCGGGNGILVATSIFQSLAVKHCTCCAPLRQHQC